VREGGGERRLAAIVLPPKEGFSPQSVGAIGLLVRRLALAGGAFESVVLGAALSLPPFPGIRFVPVRGAMFAGRPLNWLYARVAAHMLRKLRPSVIEVHNRPNIAMAISKHVPKIPVLLVLHNDPQSAHGARTAKQRQDLLDQLALVVVVSDWMRRRFMENISDGGASPAVLYNCIDPAQLPLLVEDRNREPLILFVGRLVRDKGADTFVTACGTALAQLPGWRAVAIGADGFSANSRETEFLRQLRSVARQSGVELTGYRSHDETMAEMARAAIVVVPSRWEEPFGLVALEALACGAALICSPRGALPEIAGDAAVYVNPESSDALAEAIVELTRDTSRRTALAARGRARALSFGVTEAAAKLHALRQEAMRGMRES
jgi:UDP-glucose:(glucosyl)LPS alpha-1,2-glucosyltransferase